MLHIAFHPSLQATTHDHQKKTQSEKPKPASAKLDLNLHTFFAKLDVKLLALSCCSDLKEEKPLLAANHRPLVIGEVKKGKTIFSGFAVQIFTGEKGKKDLDEGFRAC